MKNLAKFHNNNIEDNSENLYLYFLLGESKYAIQVQHVVEIIKLPALDYPQRLPNNFVGLLNYNNFTINVLDLRFYLDVKVSSYSQSSQLVVVKTDESIFALIVDKVEDIILFDYSKIKPSQISGDANIVDFLYNSENGTISVVNLNSLENYIKKGVDTVDIDIPSLFPNDDESRYKFLQRNQALLDRFQMSQVSNIYSQDKFITFSMDESLYCINLNLVKEFLKNATITKIPCDLSYIAGVITLRGEFVTVIDLKNFLNSQSHSKIDTNECKNQIIVVETPDFVIGFLVDEIYNIIDISEEQIDQSAHFHLSKYILSEVVIDEKVYSILNMKTLMGDERFYVEDGN